MYASRRPAVGCSAWLGVFISAPAKSTPTRIELYPREFVFCPYRGLRGKGVRNIERRYCHVNSIQNPCILPSRSANLSAIQNVNVQGLTPFLPHLLCKSDSLR